MEGPCKLVPQYDMFHAMCFHSQVHGCNGNIILSTLSANRNNIIMDHACEEVKGHNICYQMRPVLITCLWKNPLQYSAKCKFSSALYAMIFGYQLLQIVQKHDIYKCDAWGPCNLQTLWEIKPRPRHHHHHHRNHQDLRVPKRTTAINADLAFKIFIVYLV